MKSNLLLGAAVKLLAGLVLLGLMLFWPAGTFAFPGAWCLIGLLFIPMTLLGLILWRKAPGLLAKRLNAKEKESEQRSVVALSGLMFVAGFVFAGLSFRFGWAQLPGWVAAVGSVLFLVSYALYAEVLRENAWLSRTVEVQENQKVVDTGLYGIVRHPMYAATILMYLSMPLVLGSWISLLCFLPYPLLIARRIANEEAVLAEDLEGYADYRRRVKYKILPFIW